MDKIDRRILLELDKNSRQPFTSIAKRLRLPKSVIAYRVRQMERNSVIQGYYAMIDTSKLGYFSFRAYLKLKEANSSEKEQIIRYFADSEMVWWVATTTFPYDLEVFFLSRTMHAFKKIWNDFLSKFKPKLAIKKLATYVELQHFTRDFLVHQNEMKNRDCIAMGSEQQVRLSNPELQVLKAISSDARAGTVVLGKKLHMSPITVKSIIRRLTHAEVIRGFRVLINYAIVGYEYYEVGMDIRDSDSMRGILNKIALFPETVYIHQTIGGRDVEFSIQVAREKGIQELLDRVFGQYGDRISDYEYFKILENRKVGYMPAGWKGGVL